MHQSIPTNASKLRQLKSQRCQCGKEDTESMCLRTSMSWLWLPLPHYSCRSSLGTWRLMSLPQDGAQHPPRLSHSLVHTPYTCFNVFEWEFSHGIQRQGLIYRQQQEENMPCWSVMYNGLRVEEGSLYCMVYVTVSIHSLISGLFPREPPAGSGSEAHHSPAAHTLWHPVQVQQGWVQDEGAGAYSRAFTIAAFC